jgi:hypothetical protein
MALVWHARRIAMRVGLATALAGSMLAAPIAVSAADGCTATATGSICFTEDTFTTPFQLPYGVSCDGFTVKVFLTRERQSKSVYDANGALVQVTRHVTFSGNLFNSVTGASVPHEGHFTITDDILAGTSTITGMLSRTVVDGEGLVWRNIGRVVLRLGTPNVLFEAGDFGTYAVIGGDASAAAELCAALG